MKIEQLSLEKITPYEFNNRNHDQQQIDRIAKSIQEFGFNQPIVIDEANVVLVGHGRLHAAYQLAHKTVPILRVVGLTDAQKKAYRILDNKLQSDSTWAFNNLELELGFLEDDGFDLELWGLSDLKAMFGGEEPETYDDEFNPSEYENDETLVKRDDLIELGPHKVWCVDIREAQPLESRASLWITDPPYGVSYKGKTKKVLTIENDDLGDEGTAELWALATAYALDNLADGASCYASVAPGPIHFLFLKEWAERGIYRQQLIWVKDSMVLGHSDYHYKHEPILYGWKPGAAHQFTNDRTKTSVLEFDRPKASREHPTMKPLELWAELIRNSSKKGDVVLDTFLGSGTTLIASDQLNRICYGMEIDPKYCHVIIERYKKHCDKMRKDFKCLINGNEYSPLPSNL